MVSYISAVSIVVIMMSVKHFVYFERQNLSSVREPLDIKTQSSVQFFWLDEAD
jgi:hypothetical protein